VGCAGKTELGQREKITGGPAAKAGTHGQPREGSLGDPWGRKNETWKASDEGTTFTGAGKKSVLVRWFGVWGVCLGGGGVWCEGERCGWRGRWLAVREGPRKTSRRGLGKK